VTGAEPAAVILATTAPGRGGVWRHIEDLVSELGPRGHRLAIALPERDGELADAARALAVPVVGFWSSLHSRDWVWHGHLHDTYDRRFLLAAAARRALGPVVLTEHLPRTNASDPALLPGRRHPLAGPAKTAFKRLELTLADAVIAVSPSSSAFLRARYGDHGRVVTVANGIAPRPDGPRPPRPDGPPPRVGAPGRAMRVLSVGSLSVQKGHELLIEAAVLAHEPWEVTVLGDGPGRAALARARAWRTRRWPSTVPRSHAALPAERWPEPRGPVRR
jgi:glycosyltransferase involved in cell wall biosynthesis